MSMTATDNRDALEAALLQAKIDRIEGENRNRLARDLLPAVGALLIVIAGIVAGSIFISGYWESEVASAREDLNALASVRSDVENSIAQLQSRASEIENAPGGKDGPRDVMVGFHDCDGMVCSFSVESTSRDARIDAFSGCNGAYIIPDAHPEFENASCQSHVQERVCSANDARTICRFGPFAIDQKDTGWWVRVISEGKTTVRYANFVAEN